MANYANGSIPSGSGSYFQQSWSPDSKWITFLNAEENGFDAVFMYEVATGKTVRVTDGMSDAGAPSFSADGKYLFFPASTNSGAGLSGLHMQTYDRASASNLYAAVLSKSTATPFTPESDEETVKSDDKDKDKKKIPPKLRPPSLKPQLLTRTAFSSVLSLSRFLPAAFMALTDL